MSKNILKKENIKEVNAAVLSVVRCDEYFESFGVAEEVCERFILSSGLLPEDAFLGWQISADAEGKLNVFAFSSPGVKVTKEDFGWIFKKCASVEDVRQDCLEDMRKEGRKVYALKYLPDDSAAGVSSQSDGGIYYKDLFEALSETGAVIRITAMADGSGMIFISLSEEMTLRMRAMVSSLFPRTAVTEIGVSDGDPDNMERFSDCLTSVMKGFFGGLMLEAPKEEAEIEFEDDFSQSF